MVLETEGARDSDGSSGATPQELFMGDLKPSGSRRAPARFRALQQF